MKLEIRILDRYLWLFGGYHQRVRRNANEDEQRDVHGHSASLHISGNVRPVYNDY